MFKCCTGTLWRAQQSGHVCLWLRTTFNTGGGEVGHKGGRHRQRIAQATGDVRARLAQPRSQLGAPAQQAQQRLFCQQLGQHVATALPRLPHHTPSCCALLCWCHAPLNAPYVRRLSVPMPARPLRPGGRRVTMRPWARRPWARRTREPSDRLGPDVQTAVGQATVVQSSVGRALVGQTTPGQANAAHGPAGQPLCARWPCGPGDRGPHACLGARTRHSTPGPGKRDPVQSQRIPRICAIPVTHVLTAISVAISSPSPRNS